MVYAAIKDKLIIPMYDLYTDIQGLQFIYYQDSQCLKRFSKGAKKKGLFYLIGEVTETLLICEGYATGATIFEASQCGVIVAFDCNNLLPVAKLIRGKYPTHKIIIAADNDIDSEHNPGLNKAKEAALAINATIVIPDFNFIDISTNPTDFNDLMQLVGLAEVRKQLNIKNLENDIIDENEIINYLVNLSKVEYDRQREPYAKKLKIRKTILDEMVKAKRVERNNIDNASIFPHIEPWHETVTADTLLNLITYTLQQYVILNENEAKAVALWIVFTYCIDALSVAPILNIASPEKRCGKSTLITLIQYLVNRPLAASNISPAALFRTIETLNPTLLLDETDTFIHDERSELRGIINSGHTRSSAYVIRTVGDTHEPRRFLTWCAKCLAGIGNLPDTIKDRSIVIQLRRKLAHETVANLRHADKYSFAIIQRKCARFAMDNFTVLQASRPSLPTELNDRAADNWEPLVAIADLASNEWNTYARQAALALSISEETVSISVELLQDVKAVFELRHVNRLSTTDLLEELCSDTESPWLTYNRGKPLSARQLAKKLKEYGISSKNLRIGNNILKGYELEDFTDAFSRYLPSIVDKDISSATTLQPSKHIASHSNSSATENTMLRTEKRPQLLSSTDCSAIADKLGTLNSSKEQQLNNRERLII